MAGWVQEGGTASKTNERDAQGANGIVGWLFSSSEGHEM